MAALTFDPKPRRPTQVSTTKEEAANWGGQLLQSGTEQQIVTPVEDPPQTAWHWKEQKQHRR
jgi:hypothetical protein